MTEQSVRDRIVALLTPPDDLLLQPGVSLNSERAADAIIQLIRGAMLSPATVKAAHKGVPPPCQIERVITNALNEVFGKPDVLT